MTQNFAANILHFSFLVGHYSFEVLIIATPKPFITRLNSPGFAYWRKPGRLTRSSDLIAAVWC
jgi:hypothetical protein